jgi:GNAT superfamily N-acetyltransferase
LINVRRISDSHRSAVAEIMLASDADLRGQAFRVQRYPDTFEYFVALRDNQVVGFIEGHFQADYNERFDLRLPAPQGWIHQLEVSRRARRAGVGRALVRHFALEARSGGCTHLACLVDQSTPARDRLSFFLAAGFRPIFEHDPEDAVFGSIDDILVRCLAQPEVDLD